MPGLIPLALFIVSLLFFVGGYFFSSTFYYHKYQIKYQMKRMFPYEFNYPSSFKNNVYGNIAFIIAILGVMSFYIYHLTTGQAFNVTNIVLTVMAIASAGLICCLLFMPLQFLRTHMVISTFAMVFSFGVPALNSLVIFGKYQACVEQSDKVICLIALSLSAVLACIMILLSFNPKATYKIYLEKEIDETGQEKAVRPKSIPMAFNEWWSIITFIVSPLGLVIISFIK